MAKLERTEKPFNVIIEERQRGELGLPEIQRGYVWKQTQVRDLMESMYKEYPCGLILLWKPPSELLDSLTLKKSAISSKDFTNDKKPTFLVLDGQQRITSFLRVLEGVTDVYFNVEEEKFEIKSPKIKGNPLWISITKIMKDGAINSWEELKTNLNASHDKDSHEYLKRLSRIEKIKEYRIPVEILHTDDYEEITEAFIRINSRGTKLREAELALAQLALKLPSIISCDFEEALDEYEENNFKFEARFLIRCFVALATGQSRYKFLTKLWKSDKEELVAYWKQVKAGLDYTINFLKNNVGIESSDWIPSLNALVPLVVFFSKKTSITPEEEKLLLFWYYSACMWGRYSSSAETKLDQDLNVMLDVDRGAIKDNAIDSLIKNCRKDVKDLIVDEEELIETYQRSSFMPVLFAISRKNRSKDWFTGLELSSTNIGPTHQIELHHIHPRSLLKKLGFATKEHDDLSNIVFLSQKANRTVRNSEPIQYIKQFNIDKDRLNSQFVPTDESLWQKENYTKFLEARRKSIAKAMNDYLRSLGGQYMEL